MISADISMCFLQQMVACSILTALLNEYSSTSRSSSVGLSWEFHSQCKITFEVCMTRKYVHFHMLIIIITFSAYIIHNIL